MNTICIIIIIMNSILELNKVIFLIPDLLSYDQFIEKIFTSISKARSLDLNLPCKPSGQMSEIKKNTAYTGEFICSVRAY